MSSNSAWEAVAAKFPIGARIQLNAGGPIMSVEDHNEFANRIECMWFIGRRLQREQFPPEALNLVPEDTPSDMTATVEEERDCIPF
jgi:uncharacterized protein YodC (DUF2158 family)